jgi:PAS domain S-box-containing protein
MKTSAIGPDLQGASQRGRELQAEAEATGKQFEQMLSRISDPVVTFDRNWRYTYINEKSLEVLDKRRDELPGQVIWDVFPDLVRGSLYAEYHRAMDEQTPVQFESYDASSGRWFESRLYPSPEGLTIIAIDITERTEWKSRRTTCPCS